MRTFRLTLATLLLTLGAALAGPPLENTTLTGTTTFPVGSTVTINGTLNGTAVPTGTVSSITLTQPSAGLTISNSGTAITGSGTRTFTLSNDLLGIEGLSSTGFPVRTATDTWAQRSIAGTSDKITVTNGDGVSGNPTLTIASTYAGQSSIATVGTLTSGSIGSGFTAIGLGHLAQGGATTGQTMTWNGTAWAPTSGGTGDMTKSVYDPQGLNLISGANGTGGLGGIGGHLELFGGNEASATGNLGGVSTSQGGTAGVIYLNGGNAAADVSTDEQSSSSAAGGGAGSIYLNGGAGFANADGPYEHAGGLAGVLNLAGGDGDISHDGGQGGSILLTGAPGGNGGSLIMSATTGHNGGSIDTTAGGSITMGAGSFTGGTGNLTGGSVTGTILTTAGSGASLTGLNASNLASGTVPDARFPATLPSASGANLTSLNASNVSSGTLSASRLPALDTIDNGLASNGLIARTAANTRAARTITAGTGISVTNGDGVSGNPTVAVASSVVRTLDSTTAIVDVVSSTTETSIYTFAVPANTQGANGKLRLQLMLDFLNNTGSNQTFTVKVKFGGSTLFADSTGVFATSASRRYMTLDVDLANIAATNVQHCIAKLVSTPISSATTGLGDLATTGFYYMGGGTGTVDTTSSATLDITITQSTNSANMEMRMLKGTLELEP